jgi:hypothetical protein
MLYHVKFILYSFIHMNVDLFTSSLFLVIEEMSILHTS